MAVEQIKDNSELFRRKREERGEIGGVTIIAPAPPPPSPGEQFIMAQLLGKQVHFEGENYRVIQVERIDVEAMLGWVKVDRREDTLKIRLVPLFIRACLSAVEDNPEEPQPIIYPELNGQKVTMRKNGKQHEIIRVLEARPVLNGMMEIRCRVEDGGECVLLVPRNDEKPSKKQARLNKRLGKVRKSLRFVH